MLRLVTLLQIRFGLGSGVSSAAFGFDFMRRRQLDAFQVAHAIDEILRRKLEVGQQQVESGPELKVLHLLVRLGIRIAQGLALPAGEKFDLDRIAISHPSLESFDLTLVLQFPERRLLAQQGGGRSTRYTLP